MHMLIFRSHKCNLSIQASFGNRPLIILGSFVLSFNEMPEIKMDIRHTDVTLCLYAASSTVKPRKFGLRFFENIKISDTMD